jgi:hypothetical protein
VWDTKFHTHTKQGGLRLGWILCIHKNSEEKLFGIFFDYWQIMWKWQAVISITWRRNKFVIEITILLLKKKK